MFKPMIMGLLIAASNLTGVVMAEEAKFDPGVPAPKVADDYYAGAEKVIVHISVDGDEQKYMGMLGNVSNYINALDATGKKTDAIIVMNGDGLGLLTTAKQVEMNADAKLPIKINELKEKGVKFEVCYNTLVGRKIKFEDLYDAKPEDVVPSGVAEESRLQAQGYRLLKL